MGGSLIWGITIFPVTSNWTFPKHRITWPKSFLRNFEEVTLAFAVRGVGSGACPKS